MHIAELETPVPVVDIDRMEANITHLQIYLDEHNIANRPHIKTHKIPAIAKMQMDAAQTLLPLIQKVELLFCGQADAIRLFKCNGTSASVQIASDIRY